MLNSISNAVDSIKTGRPTVQIKHTSLAGSGLARVVVEVVHAGNSRTETGAITKELNGLTKNKLRVVAGTFQKVQSGRFGDTLVGMMAVNKQVKPYEDELKGFRCVASNQFMDEEKGMWFLEETASGRVLVKQNDEDRIEGMREMLSSICSSSQFKAEASARVEAKGGDYVSYVTQSGSLSSGFVVAEVGDEDKILVLPLGATEFSEVPKEAINLKIESEQIQSTLPEQMEEDENTITASARGRTGIQEMIEYYRRLYGRHPAYFQALVERINKHAYF